MLIARDEHAVIILSWTTGPVHDAAARAAPLQPGVKRPQVLAGVGLQRKRLVGRRGRVEDAINDDGLGLKSAGFAGVVRPGDLEPPDVAAVDLLQRRIADLVGAAAVEPFRGTQAPRYGRKAPRLRRLKTKAKAAPPTTYWSHLDTRTVAPAGRQHGLVPSYVSAGSHA